MRALWTAVLAVGLIGCQSTGEKNVKLETQKDKVSYSIGLNIGKNMTRDSIAINPDIFLRGVLDAAADSAHRLMTDKEMQETMMAFQEEMQKKQMEQAHAAGEKNRLEGEAFLAENAKTTRRGDAPQRSAVQNTGGGQGQKTQRRGHRQNTLQRQAAERHRV